MLAYVLVVDADAGVALVLGRRGAGGQPRARAAQPVRQERREQRLAAALAHLQGTALGLQDTKHINRTVYQCNQMSISHINLTRRTLHTLLTRRISIN